MSEPLRISCPGVADTPTVDELERLATRQHHVVLVFPLSGAQGIDVDAITSHLASVLSENVSVFDTGGFQDHRCVTIKRVIDRPTVLLHAESILAAALSFKEIANEIMARLSAALEVPLDSFAKDPLVGMTGGGRRSGRLDADWEFYFHGMQCRFDNRKTGQVVEVELGYAGEFGALDPWFFHAFLSTTPRFAFLTKVIEDDFHDALRALEVLAEHGLLRTVRNESGVRRFVTEHSV